MTRGPIIIGPHGNDIDLGEITEKDIEDLFAPVFKETKESYKRYWLGRGECPQCQDGTKPICEPGGTFVCPKCNWRK